MSSLPEWAYDSPPFKREILVPSFTPQQKAFATLVLVALGYFTVNSLQLWPPSLASTFWEWFVYLTPSRVIYAAEHLIYRSGYLHHESPLFGKDHFGSQQAKSEALHRLIGDTSSPVAGVIKRAKSFSGLNNVFRTMDSHIPPGLANQGNSCYQSSILQALASLPAFLSFILDVTDDIDPGNEETQTIRALSSLLLALNDENGGGKTLRTPSSLMSIESDEQQDAQEYFSKLLDDVDKEVRNDHNRKVKKLALEGSGKRKYADYKETMSTPQSEAKDSDNLRLDDTKCSSPTGQVSRKEESPAHNIQDQLPELPISTGNPVDGLIANTFTCSECNKSETKCELFNCLLLDLGMHGGYIENLLDKYTAPVTIEGVECTHCTRVAQESASEKDPKATSEPVSPRKDGKVQKKPVLRTKTKQDTLARLPQDLVIHINRSIHDMSFGKSKNNAAVDFPQRFEINKEWCFCVGEEDALEPLYELRATVIHSGRHEAGHYIAYCKRGKQWYCFDDDYVTTADLEEVLRERNAFMLFYEASEPIPSSFQAIPMESIKDTGGLSQENAKSPALTEDRTSTERESCRTKPKVYEVEETEPSVASKDLENGSETANSVLKSVSTDQQKEKSRSSSSSNLSEVTAETTPPAEIPPAETPPAEIPPAQPIPIMQTATPANSGQKHTDTSPSEIL